MIRLAGAILALAIVSAGCTPTVRPAGPPMTEPVISAGEFTASDGAILPARSWIPENDAPRAIVLALHGFNDYSNFFTEPGAFLATEGIAAYAYDQRGFGEAPNRGYWAGVGTLSDDLISAVAALRARHPGTPIYLLGESMGGAVILVTMAREDRPAVDGVILAAPAVWGRETMPWYQTAALSVTAYTVPWLKLSGRGLGVRPSDNIEMLRALSRDPLVIKRTRVDAVHGLVDLMDAALMSVPELRGHTLILYGERDELVPRNAFDALIARLPEGAEPPPTIAIYEQSYHMVLRDLHAETVWTDIAAWLAEPGAALPSRTDAAKHDDRGAEAGGA